MNVLTLDVETTHQDKEGGGTTALPYFNNRLVSIGWKWLLNDHVNYKFFYHKDSEYNRGDERLKETYVSAREIAKRNSCLMWAVSQASYDAHDRQFIDYAMLDNSKTGKAGEADIIIGIGKTGSSEIDNIVRHICISKNKINGWHGMINAQIDISRGVYY